MKFQIGAMTLGDILDRGLKLLLARFPVIVGIQAAFLTLMLPFQLLPVVTGPQSPAAALAPVGLLLVALILQPLASAAVLHVISQEYVGRPVTIGEAFSFALARFGALLGTGLLGGLLVGLGMLACLVPGVILLFWYILNAQIVVVEGLSGMDALNRSQVLTRGYRLRILGLFLVIGVIQSVLLFPLGFAAGFLGAALKSVETQQLMLVLVQYVSNVVFGGYAATCLTLMYYDLRIRKEGYDLELAAGQPTAAEGA